MIQQSDWSAPWHDADVPEYQGRQAAIDLRDWLAGKPHEAFDAFKAVVQAIPDHGDKIIRFIEVGSGCGYGKAVLNSFRPRWHYHGIELSQHMIDYAREHHPGYYQQGDAQSLDDSFIGYECVMLAAVIQHVPDWRKAVSEAARISGKWVILHRVQATRGETNEFSNYAYGTSLPTREICEQEMLDYCGSIDLKCTHAHRWGNLSVAWNGSYLFSKES